jgi:H-type small acid-soluble spore protein
MDKNRAKEIMESKGYIGVVYGDRPVWIENINNDGKAQVLDMTDNSVRYEVEFKELHEYDGAKEVE